MVNTIPQYYDTILFRAEIKSYPARTISEKLEQKSNYRDHVERVYFHLNEFGLE